MPGSEVDLPAHHLFGDENGTAVARRVDRHDVVRLPGMQGPHLRERAAA